MEQSNPIQTNYYPLGNEEILGLSSKIRYIVPPYQREYVWSSSEWEDLFSDLIESKDKATRSEKTHYIGSFVFIPDVDENRKGPYTVYTVVDGQQRLTTLSILFLAIYQRGAELLWEYRKRFGLNQSSEELETYDDLKKDLEEIDGYIYCKKITSRKESSRTLKLTLSKSSSNNENYISLTNDVHTLIKKLFFNNIQENDTLPIFERTGDKPKNSRIYKAHNYFYLELLERTNINEKDASNLRNPKEAKEAILKCLDDIQEFKRILVEEWGCIKNTVNSMNDACVLFDTLNNRGVDLSQVDIVKNYLFSSLEKANYSLDEANDQWVKMRKKMKSTTIFKKFFVDYYNIYAKKYATIKSQITESDLIKAYKGLFKEIEKEKSSSSIGEIYSDIQSKADIYQIITNPTAVESICENENVQSIPYIQHLICMNSISAIPAFGVLTYLYDMLDLSHNYRESSEDKKRLKTFEDIVYLLTRFFTIRHIINYPYVKSLPGLFELIQNELRDFKESITNIKYSDFVNIFKKYTQNSKKYEQYLLPSQDKIEDTLVEYEYDKNNSAQSIIRYLLTLYEFENPANYGIIESIHSDALRDFWMREYGKKKDFNLSIEHILPQGNLKNPKEPNEKGGWNKMLTTEELNNKEDFQNKLGNLILVGQKLNSKLGQRPFLEKRNVYSSELAAYYILEPILDEEGIPIAEGVKTAEIWNKKIIEDRTKALAKILSRYLTKDMTNQHTNV